MMTWNLLAGHAVRYPRGMEAETRKLVKNNCSLKRCDSPPPPALPSPPHLLFLQVEPDEL